MTLKIIIISVLLTFSIVQDSVADTPTISLQLLKAIAEYRVSILENDPQNVYDSVVNRVAGSYHIDGNVFDSKTNKVLGRIFLEGAVPIAIDAAHFAYYNPYCDIFVVFEIAPRNGSQSNLAIVHTAAMGGDTLAVATGEHEQIVGSGVLHEVSSGFTERVADRTRLISTLFKDSDLARTAKSMEASENRRRLLDRYLSLMEGISNLSDRERHIIIAVDSALKSGDVSQLKKERIISSDARELNAGNWPAFVRNRYFLVFVMGSKVSKSIYLALEADPTVVVKLETSISSDSVDIKEALILDYKKDVR